MKGNMKNFDGLPLNNNRGMILVVILMLLVGVMIIGVAVMHQVRMENRIVGNQLAYKMDMYQIESGVNIVEANLLTQVITSLGVNQATPLHVDDQYFPTSLVENDTHVHYIRERAPLRGKGFDATQFRVRYYDVHTLQNDQDLEVGIWKPFPKDNVVVIE